jgi:hypothetical protein
MESLQKHLKLRNSDDFNCPEVSSISVSAKNRDTIADHKLITFYASKYKNQEFH